MGRGLKYRERVGLLTDNLSRKLSFPRHRYPMVHCLKEKRLPPFNLAALKT